MQPSKKAFVAVAEKGTEAAAATGVVTRQSAADVEQPKPFTVDRPFIFLIRDATGAILFVGEVDAPATG